jgi:hypothetical protein
MAPPPWRFDRPGPADPMWSRVVALTRAEFAALSGVASLVATAAAHGLLAAILGGVVRSELTPFGYAVYAFAVAAGLIVLPLVGEIGTWLRRPPAPEWVASLPARPSEVALARLLVAGLAVAGLAAGSLLPLTLIAPDLAIAGRATFVLLGLLSTLSFAGGLLFLQGLLAARLPGALVGFQVGATLGVAVGLLLGLPRALALAGADSIHALPPHAAWARPTGVFAAPLGTDPTLAAFALPLLAFTATSALAWLGLTRLQERPRSIGGPTAVDRLVAPLGRLALAWWVRPRERAGFELVLSAMPRERETALRTYPLLAVPLLFAWVAAGTPAGEQREAFLALLLFTPGFYLPVLLAHVPASSSYAARWLLDTAPLERAAFERGAFKAVAVRYVLPLHVALGLLAWQQAGLTFALRLALPATLVTLAVLRPLYRASAQDLPLSIPPEEAGDPNALTGPLMLAGVGLAVVALIAHAALVTPWHGIVLAAVMAALELRPGRA